MVQTVSNPCTVKPISLWMTHASHRITCRGTAIEFGSEVILGAELQPGDREWWEIRTVGGADGTRKYTKEIRYFGLWWVVGHEEMQATGTALL